MMKWKIPIPNIPPVLRISIGLLLLTMSLILVGDVLGIVPNQRDSEITSRKFISESLAIQISSEMRENRLNQAINLLNSIVKRNENIQSMSLRTVSNKVIMKSTNHEIYWKNQENDSSTINYIQVPIYAKSGRWGTLEVSFVPMGTIWSNMFTRHSFSGMLLFMFIFGFIGYWLFLKRALSELDPSSVVPDRVRSALDGLKEGLIIIDNNERIVFVNNALTEKLSLTEAQLIGKKLSHLSWQDNEENKGIDIYNLPWNVLLTTGKIPTLKTIKLKTIHESILTFDVNVSPLKTPNQKLKGVIVTIDDVTTLERKNNELNHILKRLKASQEEISRQNTELLQLSTHDPLTNLLNRRALFQALPHLLAEAKEQGSVLSCVILDIDFFKSVNDTYGHTVGDRVLRAFSKILQSEVLSDHLVSRYGGEEFVVIFPQVDMDTAIKITEKIRMAIESYSFEDIAEGLRVTSSFGVSSTQENETWEADTLIDFADKALYIAKQTGRNKVVAYDRENKTNIETSTYPLSVRKGKEESIPKIKELNNNASLNICEDSEYVIILDRLTQAQKWVQREKKHLAVLAIFIDTIQLTNNAIGHAVAKKLKAIAFERLMETFRVSDSVTPTLNSDESIKLSRVSDSEFISVLTDIKNDDDITWAIFRIMKVLGEPVEIDGHEIVMRCNIGVSIYPSDAQRSEQLLENSKIALLSAQKKGRGEFSFYNKEMNIQAKKALQLESQLHLAQKRGELYLNFQPIVNLNTGETEKIETLLRWKHPELGLVSPEVFIDIAEHSGSIKEIGKWVIEQACRQLYIWQKNGYNKLKMSINLSSIQFYQKDIVEEILTIVKKENVLPQSIIFELTETALLKKYTYITDAIYGLHNAGFSLALDDFGTGYSSLTYLQKFPINLIKIDRSLMIDFPNDIHAISIVSGLIGLCHNIDIDVVCEGVENEKQLQMLYDLHCDAVQGYLISKPLSSLEMTTYFESTKSRQLLRKIHTEQGSKKKMNSTLLVDVLNAPDKLS